MTIPPDITETANRIANEYHNQTPGRRDRSLADVIADALLAERKRGTDQRKQLDSAAPADTGAKW